MITKNLTELHNTAALAAHYELDAAQHRLLDDLLVLVNPGFNVARATGAEPAVTYHPALKRSA